MFFEVEEKIRYLKVIGNQKIDLIIEKVKVRIVLILKTSLSIEDMPLTLREISINLNKLHFCKLSTYNGHLMSICYSRYISAMLVS